MFAGCSLPGLRLLIISAIGCPSNEPILEFVEAMTDLQQRRNARKIFDRFEMEAASTTQAQSTGGGNGYSGAYVAGGYSIRVAIDQIPVFTATTEICRACRRRSRCGSAHNW